MAKRGTLIWMREQNLHEPKNRPAVVIEECHGRLFVVIGTGTNRTDWAPHCISSRTGDGRRLGLSKDTFFPSKNARSIDLSQVVKECGNASTRLMTDLFTMLDRDGIEVPKPADPTAQTAGVVESVETPREPLDK